jgi:DNA-binding transcriptional ArsR family regulator
LITKDEGKIEVLRLQAELCKSLADPKRLFIIQVLRGGECTVTELAERLGLKQSNTSQHLAVLRKIGIIMPRKEGNLVYYRLANSKIAEACDLVHEVIAEQLRNGQRLSGIMRQSQVKG